MSFGGQVTMLGLLVVFTALAALILCIWLMSKLIGSFSGKGKEKTAATLPVADEPAPAPIEMIEEEDEGIDPSVIAAIAAAISAYTDSGKQLVIRSVRRSHNWARAARGEQIGRF
jgi:sodium pump decarboxylase gamma subunit